MKGFEPTVGSLVPILDTQRCCFVTKEKNMTISQRPGNGSGDATAAISGPAFAEEI